MSSAEDQTLDAYIIDKSTIHTNNDVLNSHLSFPSPTPEDHQPKPETPSQSRASQLCKDRIFVGNIHSTVDEYTLFQVFSKFGKITHLDFLFHKSGPLKGKPRGYAFVEYVDEYGAQKAIVSANDKLLRGKKLQVTSAHQAPMDSGGGGGSSSKGRRTMMETGRPTTLSLLKSGSSAKPIGTAAKIARMEAKLRQLEDNPTIIPAQSAPLHPSLPLRPPSPTSVLPQVKQDIPPKVPKPTPIHTSSAPTSLTMSLFKGSSLTSPPANSSHAVKPAKSKLIGVRIKQKEKDK